MRELLGAENALRGGRRTPWGPAASAVLGDDALGVGSSL